MVDGFDVRLKPAGRFRITPRLPSRPRKPLQ